MARRAHVGTTLRPVRTRAASNPSAPRPASGVGLTETPDTDAPHVGIFWRVPTDGGDPVLVVDSEPLARSEPYGEMMTHPRGHYDVWEQWRRLGVAGLRARGLPSAISWAEYEAFPRGRVVFSAAEKVFWIYADRRLQTPAIIAIIRERLHLLSAACLVKSDGHYR